MKMKNDNNIKDNLKYLDNILGYLINSSPNYQLEFKLLYKYSYKREFEEDNKWNGKGYFNILVENEKNPLEFTISDTTQALGERLVEALYFLNREGYVTLNSKFEVKITYKGIIQYSKTFLAEHKKIKSDRLLNKWNIYVTILLTLIGLIAGLLIGK
jgi:hypothetical protein